MLIKPLKTYNLVTEIPGDKSITHRAAMFCSAASGTSVIKKPLLGADTLDTINCMRLLGADIEVKEGIIKVKGKRKFESGGALYCGNSGTTMRLLCGFLSGRGISARLTGDEFLSKRPMARVIKPLEKFGAKISSSGGFSPINIAPARLTGADISMDIASAQVKSACVLAAITAEGKSTIRESALTRDHSELMLMGMGADIAVKDKLISVNKSSLNAIELTVPGDISSAAYFMVLGALLGQVTVKSVGINPKRCGILTVFDRCGVKYKIENVRYQNLEKTADITVYKSDIKAVDITAADMAYLVDEIPVIAVMLALANGVSKISGAGELRVKESDRIKTTVNLINAVGGKALEQGDGILIEGVGGFLGGGEIDSSFDHRIAMSATVAFSASMRGGKILRAQCVDVSFPTFYNILGGGVW